MAVGSWEFEPEDQGPGPRPAVWMALVLDEAGYKCVECGTVFEAAPYGRIRGTLVAYDGDAALRMRVDWLCRSCWRMECIAAGIVW